MKIPERKFIWVASIAGIIVFVGDFLVTFILGFFYPNYSHLKIVMSELGTGESPVAIWINLWWIVFGTFFVIFGIGILKAFGEHKKASFWGMILMILFGVGGWICGGLFPMDPGGAETTLAGKLHGICGGVGYLALLIVPLVLLPIFSKEKEPRQYWVSISVFVAGITTFILFLASEDATAVGSLLSYPGLWQRLFLLVNYAYLGMIAVLMMRLSYRSVD